MSKDKKSENVPEQSGCAVLAVVADCPMKATINFGRKQMAFVKTSAGFVVLGVREAANQGLIPENVAGSIRSADTFASILSAEHKSRIPVIRGRDAVLKLIADKQIKFAHDERVLTDDESKRGSGRKTRQFDFTQV